MFKVLATMVLALGLSFTATQASAGWRQGQDLMFVADTTIPARDGTMALCHLVDFMDVLFVPVYTTLNGYVLSSDGCTGDMYRDLTTAQFSELQAAGVIPADLPAVPTQSPLELAWGHAWLILAVIAVLKTVFLKLRGAKGRKTAAPDMLAIHALVAMSQVAIADGRIEDKEVHQIASILTRLTGQGYSPQKVMELLGQLNPSAADISQIGQDLSDKDRQIVLEAALNIAVADGEIHPNEYAVVSDMAQRMRIGADQFRGALARISAHLQTVPAA